MTPVRTSPIRGILGACCLLIGAATLSSCTDDSPTPSTSPTPTHQVVLEDGAIVADYPRLLISLPWGQPVEDIARFDAVQGGWSYPGAFDEVRAVNPNILIFEAMSGCELGLEPEAQSGPAVEDDIPPEWFLTQVGSALAEPVDATSTTLRVEAMTASADGQTISLFEEGDAVLIDGETAIVTAVDPETLTLTVERGWGRPASEHPAGTRIAAHVNTWPMSMTMNVSTLAPLGRATSSPTDESYAEYNARYGIDLAMRSGADGLFLDRTDPYVSDLLHFPNVRSLDLDQSNTLVTDYSAYDEAWGEGIRVFEAALRDGLGDDAILYANRGMANLDLINGHHNEAFPMDDGTTYGGVSWPEVMFGDGGYLFWLEGAFEPQFVVIQTYADETVPAAALNLTELDDLQASTDCTDPDYVPDYRKMRFGLTTTLLGDGFFNFEWSTYAQSWLCTFWFDEYDNAGAGRGYLGQPLGDAYRPLAEGERRGVIFSDDAENAPEGWAGWADPTVGLTIDLSGSDDASQGSRVLEIETGGVTEENWRSSVSSGAFPIEEDVRYTLEFDGRADPARNVQVVLQQSSDPWTENVSLGWVHLTPDWTRVRIMATAGFDDAASSLAFRLGDAAGTIWMDDLTLTDAPADVWRRDFEGGVVLVNASNEERTIPLGGAYRKIAGTQDPEVNDGGLVTEVTLPPLDGIILLTEE